MNIIDIEKLNKRFCLSALRRNRIKLTKYFFANDLIIFHLKKDFLESLALSNISLEIFLVLKIIFGHSSDSVITEIFGFQCFKNLSITMGVSNGKN